MIGQSLPFVCILIISYIAIGSNLVVITSDIPREEQAASDHSIDKYLKSFESAKLLRKRNTFDENGNLDLHHKAITSESKLWFQFTSPTPAYLYKSTDDSSSKDIIAHREQVQGPSRQRNDAQFVYTVTTNPSSEFDLLGDDSFSINYVGCFSTWEKQYTNLRPADPVNKYDDTQLYITCARKCRQMGTAMQVSFVRGAECQCSATYEFNSELKHDFYCNIACPVKDVSHPTSNPNHALSSTPCGGNQGYSVYCISGDEDCKPLLERAELQRSLLVPPEGRHDSSLPGIQRKPVPVLEQLCAKCHKPTQPCGRPFLFPDFDYFPTNSPEKCISYCNMTVPYVLTGKAEKERAPKQYALLTWWRDQSFQLPICSCVNDDILEVLTEVEDASQCNMKCPGKPEATCGGEDHDEFLFATLYCVNTKNGICIKNEGNDTTDTTSLPSLETEDPDCSLEYIDCDDVTDPETTTEEHSTSSEISTTTETTTPTEETKETTPTIEETTETTTTTEETTTTNTTTTTTTVTTPTTTTASTPSSISTSSMTPITTVTTTETTTPTTTVTTTETTTPITSTTTTSGLHCDTKCQAVDRHGYYWEVCAGNEGIVRCEELSKHSNSTGLAFWRCSNDGQFVTPNPDVSSCTSLWLEGKHEEVEKIERIEDADVFVNKLAESVKNAKRPNSTSKYYGHEIKAITLLVELTVSKARNLLNQSTFPELESVIDKAVDLNAFLIQYHDPWKDLPRSEKSEITTNIINNTEEALFHLTHDIHDGNYTRIFTLNNADTNSFLILAESLDKEHNKNYEFPPKTGRDEHDSYIKLPEGWGKLVPNKQVEIAAMSIDSEYISSLMPGQYDNLVSSSELDEGSGKVKLINGRLLSFTLLSAAATQSHRNQVMTSAFNRPTMTFTGKGIEITFLHDIEAWGKDVQNVPRNLHDGEQPKAVLGTSECRYWDTDTYTWSPKGCKIIKANRYETVCECSHLTSFAILMDVHNYVGKELGLQILTLILCPASEIALFISIIILSSVNGLQKFRATITKNLALCLIVGNALVLFVLDRNYFNMNEEVCIGAAIFTHYVFLCAFMWMLIEGIQLYRMVVHVFDSGRSYIKHFGFFAYGSPLIIIAITAATGYLKGDKPYGGDVYCWLEGNYIWSFMAVVAFVTMANLIILFIALKTAYQVQQSKKHLHSPSFLSGKMRSYKTWLKGCFSLTVILGLTWVVGFFTLMKSPGGIIAAYIFTILNASQGLFIFFFNCVFNEKVRSLTRRNLSTYIPSWLSSSSVSSNPGGNESVYGKRPLSSMKSGESIISEKGSKKQRVSARRQISSPIEIEGKINTISAEKMTNEVVPTRRLPRSTKVGFVEANNIYISSHAPVQRYESNGTISSMDSIPTSDAGHISSDNSQSILISKARFYNNN